MRLFRVRLVLALVLVAVPVTAVATGMAPAAGAGPAAGLTVRDFEFVPATLTVPAGTTVRVTNTGTVAHTWSSDAGAAQAWDSGPIDPGSSFSVVFSTPGTFHYHCNIHTFMTGTIVVTAAAPTTTAAPPTTAPTVPAGPGRTAAPPAANPTPAPAVAVSPVSPVATALPRTGGSNTGLLVMFGATLALFGIACTRAARRPAVPRHRD